MKFSQSAPCVVCASAALFVLAGCNGAMVSRLAPAGSTQSSVIAHRGSWIAASVAKGDLLYVSVSGGSVNIYSWRTLKLVGTLTGFQAVEGQCVDKAQNVWIVDFQLREVYEFAHGGTTILKGMGVPGGWPLSCAVDPKNGNLAVVINEGYSSSSGGVEIYRGASGTPTEYQDSRIFFYEYAAYDPAGNLFVNGLPLSGPIRLAELHAGGNKLEDIAIDETIEYPGGVAWDGKHLAVGNGGTLVYQFSISGSKARTVGTTTLKHAANPSEFFVTSSGDARVLVAADGNYLDVPEWRYPVGGQPIRSIGNITSAGVTLSRGKK